MLLGCLMLLTCAVGLSVGGTVHLYVSPNGNDGNTGLNQGQPLKTLNKALDRLDDHDVAGNTVFVELAGGYHDLPSTLHFTKGFSQPVTFRALNDQEVHVTGGKRIASNLFHQAADHDALNRLPQESRSKVLQADLHAAGVSDLGHLTDWGAYRDRHAALEVFVNGKPQHMARWPNDGYIDVTGVPDGQDGKRIQYSTDRGSRWAGEKDPWVWGFWMWSWADYAMKIINLDTHTKTITLANKSPFGLKTGHHLDLKANDQGGYFRVVNMLSELDQPGEFYVDRTNGHLYIWPDTSSGHISSSDIIYVSILDSCIKLDQGVHNVAFQGFTLEACRYHGIEAYNIHDVTLQNMEIKNTGANNFHCGGDCRRVTVSACEFHHGDGGVYLEGGDRPKLESSGNVVEDNHIWEFSRVAAVGHHGIMTGGVNNVIRHNHIHHGPYTAIWWAGNEHMMEYNHVHHMCMVASDCGGLHSGRDWTWRGNVVRYNMIHHVLRPTVGAQTRGIMLDDQVSSVVIEHNVFFDNEVHMNIGGGRDNVVRYNVFYNATAASIQVDGRGSTKRFDSDLYPRLEAMPYTGALWSQKYPELAAIKTHDPDLPEGNKIYMNTFYNDHGIGRIFYSGVSDNKSLFDVHDNHASRSSTDYWSPHDMDFRLRCTAADRANGVNFQQPVTLADVGVRHPTGPKYLHIPVPKAPHSGPPSPCAGTLAPATSTPHAPFIPDGSDPSARLAHLTDSVTAKTGCWLVVGNCPNHPEAKGTYEDNYGEQHESAGSKSANCLKRASEQWAWCGSSANDPIYAVYAPTGATTFAAGGCYMADFGCPAHYGVYDGRIAHDTYAETQQNGGHDEEKCLSRAAAQWNWCGADTTRPVVSVFGPTGHKRVSGGGCWIETDHCTKDTKLSGVFYDAWGATNMDTDHDHLSCLERATYWWQHCGSDRQFPVTAHFRPDAASRTVP